MVQILDPIPTFGQQLARAIGGGIGSGASQVSELSQKLMGERRKKTAKDIDKLGKESKSYLKGFAPDILLDQDAYHDFLDRASNFIQEGYSRDDAMRLATQSPKTVGGQELPRSTQGFGGLPESKSSGSFLNRERGQVDPATGKPISESPQTFAEGIKRLAQSAKMLPSSLTGLLESAGTFNLLPLAQQKSPKLTIEEILANQSAEKPGKYFNAPSEMLTERALQGMTPEQQEQALKDLEVQNLALGATALGSGFAKSLSGLRPRAPKTAKINIPEAAARTAEAAPEGIAKGGLEGRVGQATETPTSIRMNRLAPESRMYKAGEQSRVLKEQLSNYPKYAAEIAADAEKRAERLNRPIGERAMATKESRMALAESELPKARQSYENAIARVRALENEISRLPETETPRVKALLEAATNELRDSEFFLRQMLGNAKTGEARGGLAEMRQAAQEKLLKLADEAQMGEEIKLAKSDYSPELIKRAGEISKKKPLSANKTEDFYTQVHDEYARQYSNRLTQLQEELKKPVRSMADAEAKRHVAREMDAIKKMIRSAEAENTIHRHNLALREMNQRKLAHDRLTTKSSRMSKEPKIEQIAKEKIWKEKFKEAKSPEETSKLADDISEEVAKENPKMGEKIKEEKSGFKEAFEKVKQAEENAKNESSKTSTNEKEAVKRGHRIWRDLKEAIDALKAGNFSVFKTSIGKGILGGIIIEIINEVAENFGFKVPRGTTTLVSAAFGTFRGAPYRIISSLIVKGSLDKFKKENYKSAIRSKDRKKSIELRNKYKSSLIKEAEDELRSRRVA